MCQVLAGCADVGQQDTSKDEIVPRNMSECLAFLDLNKVWTSGAGQNCLAFSLMIADGKIGVSPIEQSNAFYPHSELVCAAPKAPAVHL